MENRYQAIKNYLVSLGEPSYRFDQIASAIFEQGCQSFEEITTISKELRKQLEIKFGKFPALAAVKHQKDSRAEKILFKFADNQAIESVLMKYKTNNFKTKTNMKPLRAEDGPKRNSRQ